MIDLGILGVTVTKGAHASTTEAFAVIREAGKRKLGMHHFDLEVSLFLSCCVCVCVCVWGGGGRGNICCNWRGVRFS